MRLAVFGGGLGAEPHIKAVDQVDGIELAAVAEINPERRSQLEAKYAVKTYNDYNELLQRENIDAVLVALPHKLHVDASLAALQSGAHLLVEKPLATTVEGCDAIIDAAKAAGKTLMVGHTHHFIPNVMEAREIVRSGELGDILMATDAIYAPYFTPQRPRWFFDADMAGGGSWVANGVHLVDRTCWIMGELPQSVYARMQFHPDMPRLETSVTATLTFPSGKAATILMAMLANGPKEEGEVLGTEGSVRFSAFRDIVRSDGRQVTPVTPRFTHNARAAQLQAFRQAIETGQEPPVTGEWGRAIVRTILAAYRSHEIGEPVSLEHF